MKNSLQKRFYLIPHSLIELQKAIVQHAKHRFIAGGTDLMPNRHQGISTESVLIDLSAIQDLKGIEHSPDSISIGSMTTLEELINNDSIRQVFPLLIEACRVVGSPLIRNRATIGGNLLCENRCLFFNQSAWWRDAIGSCLKDRGNHCIATGSLTSCFSAFVSDIAPALIVLNAKVEIMNAAGENRSLAIASLYSGNGIKPQMLEAGDLLLRIVIPVNKLKNTYFRKLRLRESLDFTALTLAAGINEKGVLRLSASGIDPKPMMLETQYPFDLDAIQKEVLKQARAVENDMLNRKYRRQMLINFLKDCFTQFKI